MKALGPEVTEGVISVDLVPNESGKSYADFAAKYKQATGAEASTNVYAAMCYDMVMCLALAM